MRLRIDRAVGQRRGQRRDRVHLLGAQRAVARQAEGAEPLAALVARDVERTPPKQSADRRRRLTEPEGHPVEADLLERLVLVPFDGLLELGERLLLRRTEQPDEDTIL